MICTQLSPKHLIALIVFGLVVIGASIEPLEYGAYALHQLGTVIMLAMLFVFQKKFGLSFLAFCSYLMFLTVHVIAAHYLYSYVPYSIWTQSLLNLDLNQYFGWQRNMFDRLVHFCYGLFLYPFFARLFQCWLPQVGTKSRFLLVLQFVMASSVFYEWIEWWLAVALSPEEAEKYNGQQGDLWDAHQDMLFATLGTLVAGLLTWISTRRS